MMSAEIFVNLHKKNMSAILDGALIRNIFHLYFVHYF